MKNCLLLFPACLLGFTAFAQPEKGQFMLNLAGNAGWGESDGGAEKRRRFTAQLNGAYFLNRRFAVGLQAEYGREVWTKKYSGTNQYTREHNYNEFRIGPMARYYFRPGKKTSFFLQTSAGLYDQYSNTTYTTGPGQPTEKRRFDSPAKAFFHLTPGFAWFPTERLAIEATALQIGYEYSEKQYPQHHNHQFGILGLSAKLGVTYLIGGKPKPQPTSEL